jgi:serine/threonine-protein kinase
MNRSSSSSPSRIPSGTRLNGIYEIDHPIGSGGMGEIYKGHNIQTGDVVAIKVMLPELTENAAAMALFRKEASALHSLHHEAIVRYYVFTVEPVLQVPYLAMEFVEGQSLSDLLKHGPLTIEAVGALKQRVSAGLQAAHHRDVSPDNIIIPGGDVGRAKIIDFGIARSTQMGEGTIIGGGFAGKYNYVSPEQLGLFGGNVTGRSDIYSLGLLLAEALTGQPINMGGSQVDVIEKRRKVPHLGAIDIRARPLIEKMLQPDPANRLDSMAAVAAWQIGGERPRGWQQESYASRQSSPVSHARGRGRMAAIATGVLVVLLAGGGGAYYYLTQPGGLSSPAPAPPALNPVAVRPGPPVEVARPDPGAPPTLRPENLPATPSLATPGTTGRPPLTAEQPPAAAVAPGQQKALRPDAGPKLTPPLAAGPVETPTRPNTAPSTTPEAPPSAGKLPPVAMLPPRPEPEARPPATPPSALGPADRIARYLNEYQGGDCFFIMPVAVSANKAQIEGYGASAAPFHTLDEAFKRAHRFEADIGVRQVTKAQCPAITFLNRIRKDPGPAPRLQIAATNLKSGQALTGTVDGYGSRHVELLLVSDEGSVLNVSRLLKPAGNGMTFNLRMQRTGAAGPQPQLLIAVATAKPLDTLQPRGAVEADLFFPLVAGEAARSGETISATAKYFKLDL